MHGSQQLLLAVPIPAGSRTKTLDYMGWMGVSLLAITRGGGGVALSAFCIVHAYTRWWNMTDCGKKDEKRYGFSGREWTFLV